MVPQSTAAATAADFVPHDFATNISTQDVHPDFTQDVDAFGFAMGATAATCNFVAGPCRASGAVGTDNGFPALSIVPEPCSTSALLALVALAAAVSRRRMNRAWAAAMDCARKGMRANGRQTGARPRFPSARFPSRRSTNVNPLDDLVRTRNRGRTERSDGLRWVSHAAGAHTGEPANRRQDDEALHR